MIGLLLALVGALMIVAGLYELFGPWAAVGCGAVLLVVGLLVPEEVTDA